MFHVYLNKFDIDDYPLVFLLLYLVMFDLIYRNTQSTKKTVLNLICWIETVSEDE